MKFTIKNEKEVKWNKFWKAKENGKMGQILMNWSSNLIYRFQCKFHHKINLSKFTPSRNRPNLIGPKFRLGRAFIIIECVCLLVMHNNSLRFCITFQLKWEYCSFCGSINATWYHCYKHELLVKKVLEKHQF